MTPPHCRRCGSPLTGAAARIGVCAECLRAPAPMGTLPRPRYAWTKEAPNGPDEPPRPE
jgi:hypothetical protein